MASINVDNRSLISTKSKQVYAIRGPIARYNQVAHVGPIFTRAYGKIERSSRSELSGQHCAKCEITRSLCSMFAA